MTLVIMERTPTFDAAFRCCLDGRHRPQARLHRLSYLGLELRHVENGPLATIASSIGGLRFAVGAPNQQNFQGVSGKKSPKGKRDSGDVPAIPKIARKAGDAGTNVCPCRSPPTFSTTRFRRT